MSDFTLLLVEDDDAGRKSMERFLVDQDYLVVAVDSAQAAEAKLRAQHFSVVVTDYRLPDGTGIDVLRIAREVRPGVPVILVTAYGEVESAVSAMQLGAFHFLQKPVSPGQLAEVVHQATEKERLAQEIERLRGELRSRYGMDQMIGKSSVMQRVFETIRLAAPTGSTVLITGESGTGKELVVRAIHDLSNRREAPLVAINCAALPEGLVESELFGHEKGAFTGAVQTKKGYFESAQGGTLFIDEIGDMPLPLQPKLLRALEQRVVTHVGSSREIPIDVRIVAATNQHLEEAVRQGKFREDLYYRLSVLRIELPALRERQGDIALLIAHFFEQLATEHGHKVVGMTPEALETLQHYPWPGNIRELRNTIEGLVVLTNKDRIERGDLPTHIIHAVEVGRQVQVEPVKPQIIRPLVEVEREAIRTALLAFGGNKTRAAQALGIGLRTLQRKLATSNE